MHVSSYFVIITMFEILLLCCASHSTKCPCCMAYLLRLFEIPLMHMSLSPFKIQNQLTHCHVM